MTENDIFDFMNMCTEFLESSKELRDAASLCDDDPVKQEMIAFIMPEFNDVCAQSEGIKTLLEKQNYKENRDFVFEEIKTVTSKNLEMAKKIRDKLVPLSWS
jgi:hypothetical protein